MTQASWFVLFYGVVCVLLLVAVRALKLTPDDVTPFELKRRIAEGDRAAEAIAHRQLQLPRIMALRRVVEVMLMVAVGASLTLRYGWIVGGFTAVAAIVLADILAARVPVQRLAQRFYDAHEPRLVALVASWRWLDALKLPVVSPDNITISSKSELADIVARSGGVLSHDEQRHIQKTLSFDDITVGSIMTPRSMIDAIDVREVVGPLVLDQLHKTGHSRIPVIDADIDHVVGMLYMRDLVSLNRAARHTTIKQAMCEEVYYIHESKRLEHALHAFLRTHHHLCIVVNEFRETVGVLALEDVVEALLGRQVVDEFDEFDDLRKVAQSNPRANNRPNKHTDV